MARHKFFRGGCFLGLTFFFAACRFSSAPERPPGYLVVGIESNPLQLDPRYATDANGVRIGNLIYNSLLRADENSRLQPELAESWRLVDDRTYVFDLRRDVSFHDRKPLTAADVKYTYESILAASNRSPKRGSLKPLQAIDALGPYRVRFRLSAPYAPFPEQFTIGIVPAAHESALPPSKPPAGSGPFILESIDSGEAVSLKANQLYRIGAPQIAGVIFKIVPDAMVRVLEFKKGSIDFLQNDIEPDVLPWLKRNTPAAIRQRDGTTFQYMGMNLTHPILRRRAVRQALAQAIDRDGIIRRLLKDTAVPATGLLSPFNWAYEPQVIRWRYDPQAAKRLLDEAGYPDPDGDGPLPRFRLSFKTMNLDLQRRIAEAFKEQLRRVGIELEVRTYEWGTFFSDVKKGNFHLYSLTWVGVMDPDIMYQIFHSASAPPEGDNRGRYSNPEIDRLLEQGRQTIDPAERRIIYSQAQKILADDLPYVPLWWKKNVVVERPGLRGFNPYPDGDFISLKNVAFSSRLPAS